MKGDLPRWISPWYQHHNRKGNAPETIRAAVRAHHAAKQSEDQYPSTEHKDVRSKVACHKAANERTEDGPDESLPGNGERGS